MFDQVPSLGILRKIADDVRRRSFIWEIQVNSTPVVISLILPATTGISLSTNEAKRVFSIEVCKFFAAALLSRKSHHGKKYRCAQGKTGRRHFA